MQHNEGLARRRLTGGLEPCKRLFLRFQQDDLDEAGRPQIVLPAKDLDRPADLNGTEGIERVRHIQLALGLPGHCHATPPDSHIATEC